MLSASFITDPASDADIHVQVQVIVKLVSFASEAMHDAAAGKLVPEIFQDRQKARVRVTLMKKNRFADFTSQLQLLLKYLLLHRAWRKIAIEIQAGLTYGDDISASGQRADLCQDFLAACARLVGVDARRDREKSRVLFGNLLRALRGVKTGASDDHVHDPDVTSVLYDDIEIMHEGLVAQIGTDVDQRRGRIEGHCFGHCKPLRSFLVTSVKLTFSVGALVYRDERGEYQHKIAFASRRGINGCAVDLVTLFHHNSPPLTAADAS